MKEFLIILLMLLLSGLFGILLIQRKKIQKLTESIDTFFMDETPTELSTEDGALGHLQTNICELESRLLQERENMKQEGKNNAQFLSDISHQLKTPLAGLRLYCEMEHAAVPSPHTEKELALIEKMEQLIQNVLKLEKIRSETYTMHFENCDPAKIANQIYMEMQPLFPQKQIRVEGQAELRADKNWLYEALGNLVKNACEHTKSDGTVIIRIEQGETSVSITVEDDGDGVQEEELPRLFERFHRASNAAPNSAGIGLAITKAIVEKHHGTISARNTSKGLSIVICIPCIDANIKI